MNASTIQTGESVASRAYDPVPVVVKVGELAKGTRFESGESEYVVVYRAGERRANQGVQARPVSGPRHDDYLKTLQFMRESGITGVNDAGLMTFSKNRNVTIYIQP
jgi:hypothetical protein